MKIACLVERSGGKEGLGVPFVSIISYEVEAWNKKGCPVRKEDTHDKTGG